jgi:hypothetical protein
LERLMLGWNRLGHRERNEFLRWAHATYRAKPESELPLDPASRDDAQLTFF